MKKVALVTCDAFPELYEDDRVLPPALAGLGVASEPVSWSARADWKAYDALVIRSPWDYFERHLEFKAWLEDRVDSGVLMCNSGDILKWNYDKKYLQDLAARGVALVPTIAIPQGESADVAALARARGWDDIVVKPTVSGGAYRTYRFRVADIGKYEREIEETLDDRGVLIQPFLPEIHAGELSLLFFDGEFSHAVRKVPAPGDYRVQFQYGGTNTTIDVDAKLVEEARACVLAAPSLPVYARVDGVVKDGAFLLMELEVFEPCLFLARHAEAPGRLAKAIAGRLR